MQQPRDISHPETSPMGSRLLLTGWILVIFLFGIWVGRFGLTQPWAVQWGLPPVSSMATQPRAIEPRRTAKPARLLPPSHKQAEKRQTPTTVSLGALPTFAWERLAYARRADAQTLLNRLTFACSCGQTLGQCVKASPRCLPLRKAVSLMLTRLQQDAATASVSTEVKRSLSQMNARASHPRKRLGGVVRVSMGRGLGTGSAHAPLTIVAFVDLADQAKRHLLPLLYRLQLRYGHQNIRLVLRHYSIMDTLLSYRIAEASIVAGAKFRFWPYAEKLLRHRGALAHNDLIGYAKELKFDLDRFKRELNIGRYRRVVSEDFRAAKRLRLPGAPFVFINGRPVMSLTRVSEVAAKAWKHAQRLLRWGVPLHQLYDAIVRKGRQHL